MPIQMPIQVEDELLHCHGLFQHYEWIFILKLFARQGGDGWADEFLERSNPCQQFLARYIPQRKLLRTIPLIRMPSENSPHVLPKIALKVKHKSACRIRDPRRSAPQRRIIGKGRNLLRKSCKVARKQRRQRSCQIHRFTLLSLKIYSTGLWVRSPDS